MGAEMRTNASRFFFNVRVPQKILHPKIRKAKWDNRSRLMNQPCPTSMMKSSSTDDQARISRRANQHESHPLF